MATTCPKCHSTDTHKAPNHAESHAKHGLHMLHRWPILGVVALIASAATAITAKRVCHQCKHRF